MKAVICDDGEALRSGARGARGRCRVPIVVLAALREHAEERSEVRGSRLPDEALDPGAIARALGRALPVKSPVRRIAWALRFRRHLVFESRSHAVLLRAVDGSRYRRLAMLDDEGFCAEHFDNADLDADPGP